MPVSSRSHRKQILLFLLAVILPSLVLVVFTLRMISQEKELDQKRAVDERRRLASEIGQHLLVRLEKVKLQESSAAANWIQLSAQRDYVNSEVVLIGQVEGDRLLLPWEENKKSEEFRQLVSSSDFARKIRNADKVYPCRSSILIVSRDIVNSGGTDISEEKIEKMIQIEIEALKKERNCLLLLTRVDLSNL